MLENRMYKLTPLSKIISLALFTLIFLINHDLFISLILIIFVYFLLKISNISLKSVFNYIKYYTILILGIFIIVLLVSNDIFFSVSLSINFALLLIYVMILMHTTPLSEVVYGFRQIFGQVDKFGVKSDDLSLNFALFLDYFSIFSKENERILKAEASRGLDYHYLNYKLKIKVFMYMYKPAFKYTFIKLNDLRKKFVLNYYCTYNEKTNYNTNAWSKYDSYLLLSYLFIFIIMFLKGVIL